MPVVREGGAPFICLCPGAHFLKICPWQGQSVTYTDTFHRDKWPWKWISVFHSTSLKQAKTHTIAFSPSSEFHYTSVSSVLFWQALYVPLLWWEMWIYTEHVASSTVLHSQTHCLIVIIYIPLETFLPVLSAACFSHPPLHMSRLKALSLLHHALKAVYLTH